MNFFVFFGLGGLRENQRRPKGRSKGRCTGEPWENRFRTKATSRVRRGGQKRTKGPGQGEGATREEMVGEVPARLGSNAQRGPGMGPQWFRVGPQMSQDGPSRGHDGANMEPGWPQDGLRMAPRWPTYAQELRTPRPGGANSRGSNKCNKRYLFSQFRCPGGRSEAKMEANWGRDEAKRGRV